MRRLCFLAFCLLPFLFTACDSNTAEVPTIEDTDFATALNVDLSAMTQTDTGLYYRDLEEGTGAVAVSGKRVAVHYSGWLADGTLFDQNGPQAVPFTFRLGLGEVIPGWDEGVAGMKVGGRRQLIIPPALGYGDRRIGPIPPNSILVFDVELVAVQD